MLDLLFNNPLSFLTFGLALLVAVTIHEFSHALAADKLGDPTPRLAGRLTLNPLAHLDPIGTLALLIARIGWGKPVPIDPYNLRNPRQDTALISLAGPASNLILATILSLIMKFIAGKHMGLPLHFPLISQFLNFLISPIIILNVSLAIFNLIPVPPLDGAKILIGFLPVEWGIKFEETISQFGIFLLIFLIFPFFNGASLVSYIIFPIINLILNLIL